MRSIHTYARRFSPDAPTVPGMGAQLHTINPLLPDTHIQYIVENAADRAVFVDESLLPKLEGAVADDPDSFDSVERYVVMGESVPDTDLDAVAYENFIDDQPTTFEWPELAEDRPAGLCYTSGTTGHRKGVEYTQQMLWSHTMGIQSPQGIPLDDDDVMMPVVPMFHVNAWGLPFSATAGGAKHVYPGPKPSPEDLAGLIEDEGVTVTAGVPTVWLGLMEYAEDHDVELVHAWGMTETAPVGTVSHVKQDLADADYETQLSKRRKQGLVVPGLEFRVVDDAGEAVPHDGEAFGELHVRGPWLTTEYFARPEATESEFADGYLKTGDVVTVDPDGYIDIVDRAKDVIKSGGEWISSQELENELLGHDAVAQAAVIGVPHERWQERPLALVVPSGDEMESLVDGRVPDEAAPE